MNCIEFRRLLLIEPKRDDVELEQHRAECQSCARFYRELQQQEKSLQAALATQVPEHLAERILLANQMGRPPLRRYLMAGCVAASLAVLSVAWLNFESNPAASWSEIALSHTLNELESLDSELNYSDQQLGQALSRFHLTLKSSLGKIRYLDHCEMPGGKGLHVVIETEKNGLVTLILPPPGSRANRQITHRDGFFSNLTFIGSTPVGVVTESSDNLQTLSSWIGNQLQHQS